MIGDWSLKTLQQALGGALNATAHGEAEFTRVCTDTRAIEPGDLFVALRGPNFDGHQFLAQAKAAGAQAAVVDSLQPLDLPQWQVDDTRTALGQIARLNRERFSGPVFAVTGSSGKTTVKEMLATVLGQQGSILATRGNLNNDIGAPLTLLALSEQHQQAVIELGASAGGEIAYTVVLTQPDVAILNNAMGAHLEGFGSLQGVVKAKGEIFAGLDDTGCAVINLDDDNASYWLQQTEGQRRLTFGVENPAADIQACDLQLQDSGCYQFVLVQGAQQASVALPVMGRHMVANAVAAAAACRAQGVALDQIAAGLAAFTPVPGRMCPLTTGRGCQLIDDSYNANPSAARAAIDVLASLPGKQMLVLGDMGELGADAANLHAEVGAYAAGQGIDMLLATGELSQHTVDGFLQAGGNSAELFASHEALIVRLAPLCDATSRVLVKGSRSAAMEKVIHALMEGA